MLGGQAGKEVWGPPRAMPDLSCRVRGETRQSPGFQDQPVISSSCHSECANSLSLCPGSERKGDLFPSPLPPFPAEIKITKKIISISHRDGSSLFLPTPLVFLSVCVGTGRPGLLGCGGHRDDLGLHSTHCHSPQTLPDSTLHPAFIFLFLPLKGTHSSSTAPPSRQTLPLPHEYFICLFSGFFLIY